MTQGTVVATQMGRNVVHELNRDHVAAQAVLALADLRLELWKRLRNLIGAWDEPALRACAFGSAARGDGTEDSDIDIFLAHRADPDDLPGVSDRSLLGRLAEGVAGLGVSVRTPQQAAQWEAQVDDLHTKVQRWTGNRAHVVDVSLPQWSALKDNEPALYAEITRDQIVIVSAPLVAPLRMRQLDGGA